jgi:predicted translin family RNA/ssDNA-binding protein
MITGGVDTMRILVLRKQELGPEEATQGLTEDLAQQVQQQLEDKQRAFEEISNLIGTINQTIIDNFKTLDVNTLDQVRDKLVEAVNILGGGAVGARLFLKSGDESTGVDFALDPKVDPILDPIASDICTSAGELVFHVHDGKVEDALEEIQKIRDNLDQLVREITNRCGGRILKEKEVEGEVSAEEIRGKTPMWLASEVDSQAWDLRLLLPERGQELGRKKCSEILSKIETIKVILDELELRLTVGPSVETLWREGEGM